MKRRYDYKSKWYLRYTEEEREKIREKKRYKYASQSDGYTEHQEVPNVSWSSLRKYVIHEDIRNELRKKKNENLKIFILKDPDQYKRKNQKYYEENKERIQKQHKVYYEKNKDKISEYHRNYYLKNRDQYTQNRLKYLEENKEKISKQQKEYYEKNKEKMRKQQKEYYLKNKDRLLEQKKKREQEVKIPLRDHVDIDK